MLAVRDTECLGASAPEVRSKWRHQFGTDRVMPTTIPDVTLDARHPYPAPTLTFEISLLEVE